MEVFTINKLMILDGNSIVNRAFYAIPPLTNTEGLHTNAIYGFLNILFKYMDAENPTHLCVAFDVAAPTFRHKQYENYKIKRKGMPEELREQMPVLKEVLSSLNIAQLELAGYEADDIIGTVSKKCDAQNMECLILTGDKDDLQLATEHTKIMLVTTKGSKSDTTIYDANGVFEKYGVTPEEFIEVKALMGDPSDNIPGVPGIGEKTAFSLIQTYKSLDQVYAHLSELKPGVRNKLEENKDIAYLSRQLSIIDKQVPLPINLEDYAVKEINYDKAISLFAKLNFSSFIKRFELTKSQDDEVYAYTVVSIEELKKNLTSPFSYYLTQSQGKFLFAAGKHLAYVEDIIELKDIFEGNFEKIGHNVKEDMVLLAAHGISYQKLKFDTMIAAYLIAPHRNRYEIGELSLEYLKKGIGSADSAEAAAAANAQVIQALYEFLAWELAKNDQNYLYYEVELPLISVLADMQTVGFKVDQDMLIEFGEQLDASISQLTDQIYLTAGGAFNINSPKQLGEVLFEKLKLPIVKKNKTGYSTDADVLNKLEGQHEIISYLLDYRKLVKLKSTYVDGLLAVIQQDGRIHSSFHQTVTATGRISSTEPNLQNIPIRTELGREIRRAFVAEAPDFTLVDADYSQIELRVLAHISNDENMISAFQNNMDIHTKTASEVFGVAPEFVTSEMRFRAKAVNFGIVYGIGDFSLSQDLKITRREAKKYIEDYLKTYPNVKQYMHDTVQRAKEKGFVTTLLGRRRYIPELKTNNFNIRSFGERVAMNAPIQGSAADIIKIAMVRVHKRLKEGGFRSRLTLQVHDELLIEAHKSEKEQVIALLKEEMENAYAMSVPLVTDIAEGGNWYDSK